MRSGCEPPIRERWVLGERDGLPHVGAHVITHGQLVELVRDDAMHDAASPFGALGRVLGEVAGYFTPLIRTQTTDIELVTPAHVPAAELVGQWRANVVDDRSQRVLEQLDTEPVRRR